jgi:hypothetical protein
VPARNDAITAARFELTIDGHSVGRFETLVAAVAPGGPPRALQVHELPLVWQHAGELRSGKVAQTDHHFDVPSASGQPGRPPPHTIALKRGTGHRASLEQTRGRSVVLVGLSPAGQPIVRYRINRAWVVKITGPALNAKGGGDVAMEEIVIACEGVSLV